MCAFFVYPSMPQSTIIFCKLNVIGLFVSIFFLNFKHTYLLPINILLSEICHHVSKEILAYVVHLEVSRQKFRGGLHYLK